MNDQGPTRKKLKPAIAYVRVSTERQGRSGHGQELQMVAIREFARHEGYEIVRTFSDVETGMKEASIRNRPGVLDAIKLSREEGATILVDELGRFSRDVSTVQKIVAQGRLKVIGCRSGEGTSYASIMSIAARAQREGEQISISTKAALQKLKDQGVPLGNRTNLAEARSLAVTATKARVDKQVRELAPVIEDLRDSGCTTARTIAEGLNAKGYRTSRGIEWTDRNIRRLLTQIDERKQVSQGERYAENELWGRF
ncbi:recombinase family protein [Methylobacterium sp. 88A]|uniref:recombinase family protein n=1 Tax=Methylobacterium sp. 88A TaxID=1131813 RepID=UPI0003705178|nr:recombinase family protein [Methylobacterium sp. 88A]